ncbi:hypothetical protein F5J12DRAFT_786579 [Pisolithus orientalis]|uniref:uncharacterized protein n=1 Tax=Pisolithus orientalis TaxID=936130 RepID=UPI002224BED8|nr:uncharacterized protein F5J12DRAFT_786579 [Pisolithus orientalis]KAI5990053.1 hypothetical protein F5J12DRAFT_786579 [Pisolithus orientalis]
MLFDHCHWSIQSHWMGLVSSLLAVPFTGQFGTGHNVYAAILELIIGPLQDFQDQEVQLGLKTVLALTNQLLGAALHQLAFYIITLLDLPMSLPPCSKTMWALECLRQCTLGELATENLGMCGGGAGAQLLTVGFNASPSSAWMYSLLNMFSWHQAGTGQSHEIQTIFHHLSSISQMPLHPYFVFDGLDCPQLKRGKDIVHPCYPPLLVQCFQELLMAFGFSWHTPPGEAETELACLQSCTLVDVMVTLYNNVLLFGVTCIIHSGIPPSGKYEGMQLYSSDTLQNCTGLKWGDLLLVMLMSSVDSEVASGAAQTLPIDWWCDNICEVLQMDPQHLLGHRHHELACIIVEECIEFPDPAILAMYLLPLTSWSEGCHPPIAIVRSCQPDLASLAEFCSQHLGWSPDTIWSRLMGAHASTAMHALLQLPGNVDSEWLQHNLWVLSHSDKSYKLSVPSLPLETPVDTDPLPAYEIEMPAVMLEYSRPNLVESTVSLPHETGVIDLVGGADAPHLKAGVIGLMDDD